MAQNDLNIANQSFPSFRTDLNNALSAIQTTHSGTSRPTGAVAGQIWLDTTSATSPTLKYYDGADDISLATLDHSANTVNWLDSTVSVTGLSTTATGTVLTLTDSVTTSTVNLILDNQKEIQFRETTANGTNYIALKAPASLSADATFTLPATDGTSGQVLQTNGSGVLSFATPSGGKVLQVVTATKVDTQSTTGVDTDSPEDSISIGLSASITPSSASSRILIIANIYVSLSSGAGRSYGSIFRGTSATALGSTISNTNLSEPTSPSNRNKSFNGSFDSTAVNTAPMIFVDSPSTTSERVYEIGLTIRGTDTLYINRSALDTDDGVNGRGVSTLTLIEIGA